MDGWPADQDRPITFATKKRLDNYAIFSKLPINMYTIVEFKLRWSNTDTLQTLTAQLQISISHKECYEQLRNCKSNEKDSEDNGIYLGSILAKYLTLESTRCAGTF